MKKSRGAAPRTPARGISPCTPTETRPAGRVSEGVQGKISPGRVLGTASLDS